MRLPREIACVAVAFLGFLASCSATAIEDLASLADKDPLPYSVMVTGGSFVLAPADARSSEPLGRTYARPGGAVEAFGLERVEKILERANVFVTVARHDGGLAERRGIAASRHAVSVAGDELQAVLVRARNDGHDFLLVVEGIADGPVEYRGINDRWPFTVGAWLFALGAFISDHTYESQARLRFSLRDVYTGRRVSDPIVVEPGPVDLNMFERCSLWGFVQSILVPPFWTSTDPESIVSAVRAISTERLLVSAVRRLKSAEVLEMLNGSGPVTIEVDRVGGPWRVSLLAKERVSAVALRLDGMPVNTAVAAAFEHRLLESMEAVAAGYRYHAECGFARGKRLQLLVQTEAARVSSATHVLGVR